jgi:hypothetical protein
LPVSLYGQDAPPGVVFLLAHIAPLMAVGQTRIETDPLPFCEVNILNTAVDDFPSIDTVLASVHIFSSATTPAERAQALDNANQVHRRIMLLVSDASMTVTMPDGSHAACDYLEIVEKPVLRPYGVNTIHRYVGRYRYGLPFVAVS